MATREIREELLRAEKEDVAMLAAVAQRLDAIEADMAAATSSARARVRRTHTRHLHAVKDADDALVRAAIVVATAAGAEVRKPSQQQELR